VLILGWIYYSMSKTDFFKANYYNGLDNQNWDISLQIKNTHESKFMRFSLRFAAENQTESFQ
jgi:hypothetical protein